MSDAPPAVGPIDASPIEAGPIEAVCHSTQTTFAAVGRLAGSEIELATHAALRAALLMSLASACVAAAAIMGLILMVAALVWMGMSWIGAVASSALIAIALAALLARRARQLLGLCQFRSTRRQLAALFAISEGSMP